MHGKAKTTSGSQETLQRDGGGISSSCCKPCTLEICKLWFPPRSQLPAHSRLVVGSGLSALSHGTPAPTDLPGTAPHLREVQTSRARLRQGSCPRTLQRQQRCFGMMEGLRIRLRDHTALRGAVSLERSQSPARSSDTLFSLTRRGLD